MAISADINKEPEAAAPERFRLDLLDLLLMITQRKKRILLLTVAAMVLTAGATLLIKNTYTSTAVILPPRQDTSMSMMLSGQLGALSSLGGMSSLASGAGGLLKNPNDIYVGLLESHTVTSYLVDRYHLKEVYKSKLHSDAIKALMAHTKIELAKDNTIHISVTTKDPVFSSQLANAYVERLHDLNTTLALTDSSQRRLFYQQQLSQEQAQLAQAEQALRDVQQSTGVMQPAGQAEMISRNIATIRAELSNRQAELGSLRSFAAEENPDLIRVRAQVDSLQAQLQQAENSQRTLGPGDIEVPTSKLPNVTLAYTRKYRDVKLHEAVYETLVKQYEAAKLDEAKTAPIIQVVDPAFPAERKSGPPRTLIVFGMGMVVFLLSCVGTVVSWGFATVGHDPDTAAKLQQLRRQIGFGKV